MRSYDETVARLRAREGARFTSGGLAPQFRRYFESGQRIKVYYRTEDKVMTGWVGMTTGWAPAFLLMRSSRSIGSPWLLSAGDAVLAVKVGRRYAPVS